MMKSGPERPGETHQTYFKFYSRFSARLLNMQDISFYNLSGLISKMNVFKTHSTSYGLVIDRTTEILEIISVIILKST